MKINHFRDIWTVTKFTMRDLISRKSFRISTIIILILIVLGFNLPNIINQVTGGDFTDTVLISDPQNVFEDSLGALNDADLGYKFEIVPQTFDEIKTKIDNGDINSAITVDKVDNQINFTYIVDNIATATSNAPQTLIDTLSALYTNVQIHKLGLTDKQLATLTPTFNTEFKQTDDQNIGGNLMVTMLMSVLLFFAIYFCAYQVSASITVEKTSKIMETLVTSTSPRTIILGKTIGIGIVGLLQVLLFAITAIVSAKLFLAPEILDALFDLSNFTPYLAVAALVYFILGYFAYALLYALTGSTVSKPEDIQSANMPVAIITMIGFYLAYFTLTDPTSSLNVFAALLPISSPFCMPLRIMMGLASGWEVALSIAILLVFCYIIAKIAIKIYSSAILNYGSRMTLKDMLRTYKEKE